MSIYKKLVIILNDDLAEGVYAASGASGGSGGECMSATAMIVGDRDTEGLYRIMISGAHDGAGHTNNAQNITLVFNQSVEVMRSSAAQVISGSGTAIELKYAFWYDQQDAHKLEDYLYVAAEPGLAITGVSATDDGYISEVTW